VSEIHTTPSQRLVMMANQIAKAFAPQGETRAVAKTAEHIKAFWDPRMRRKIDEHLLAGGAGLEPYALAALTQLMAGAEKRPPADGHSPFDQGSDAG
jgi:formate dehydrogenase subunit delta